MWPWPWLCKQLYGLSNLLLLLCIAFDDILIFLCDRRMGLLWLTMPKTSESSASWPNFYWFQLFSLDWSGKQGYVVCMCMCMCVCVCVYTCVLLFLGVTVSMLVHVLGCVHACDTLSICLHLNICVCSCLKCHCVNGYYININIIYIYNSVCVCACVCVSVCMHAGGCMCAWVHACMCMIMCMFCVWMFIMFVCNVMYMCQYANCSLILIC